MLKSVATVVNTIAALLLASGVVNAQTAVTKKPGFEVLMPTGTVVPIGAQGDAVERATLTAVQLSYGMRPDVVLTSTVGWARPRPLGLGTDARLHMFTYDVGTEFRLPRRESDGRFNFKPFAGGGVGARSYNYRHVDAATTHNLAAYVGGGGELALAKIRVRLEVRDYMTWMNAAGSSVSSRRNDIMIMAGLRFGVR